MGKSWTDDIIKCFLETCIEEVTKRGRKGSSLYPDSWVKVREALKEKFNIEPTQKQMKNNYDYLKSKYAGWLYLTKKTGNVYNPDKYYLCDAAYTHTRGFMTPYRNVRYWLGDFRRTRATNKEEKFNHAHAKLRNVIERSFGVLKARFPILKRMAPFSLNVQRDITIACFAVHNFIRKERINDEFFSNYDEAEMDFTNDNMHDENEEEIEGEATEGYGCAADVQYMTNLREEIAVQVMQHNV